MCTREDGATVITASHNQGKSRDDPVKVKGNNGWGNNFVRLNLKVCDRVIYASSLFCITDMSNTWLPEIQQ
jgi:hypothetical protein